VCNYHSTIWWMHQREISFKAQSNIQVMINSWMINLYWKKLDISIDWALDYNLWRI
jgi:hypothetical protein